MAGWLDRQEIDTLFLASVDLGELLVGIEMMALGRRRSALQARLADVLEPLAGSRILPFDVPAARFFAALVGRARAAGHAISVPDGQIAAIAAVRGFTVATRDVAPFMAAGVPVINPWDKLS